MALNDGIRQKFRTQLAQLLLEDLSIESANRYFLFIGKPKAWDDDTLPDSATDSNGILFDAKRSMLAMKMIRPIDVQLMIPRIDWTEGDTYAQYDSSSAMQGERFYALTDEYNVYKCISNNGTADSVTKPTGTSQYIFTTETDGYKWKFIFKIPEDTLKFVTEEHIPVSIAVANTITETLPQFTVQSYAVDGAIDVYRFTESEGVYGRSTTKTYKIGIPSDGVPIDPTTGATLDPAALNVQGSRFVKLSKLMQEDDPYSELNNYYANYSIYVASGRGKEVGQVLNVVAYHGASRVAYVWPPLEFDLYQEEAVDGGQTILPASKYQILPTVKVEGDGAGAVARCAIDVSKKVTEIRSVKRGSGYTVATAVITSPVDSGTGPAIVPEIGPPGGHGSDAVDEFGGSHLMMLVDVEEDEDGDFTLVNQYRQFGIVRNPVFNDGTGRIAGTEIDRIGTMLVEKPYFADVSYQFFPNKTFVPGNIIFGESSRAMAKVVDWVSTPGQAYGILYFTPLGGKFQPPDPSFGDHILIAFTDTAGGTFTVGSRVYQPAPEANSFGITADGFVVSWTPGATHAPELVVKVVSGSFSATGTVISDETEYDSSQILAVERYGGENIRQMEISNEGEFSFLSSETASGTTGPDTTQNVGRIVEYDRSKVVDPSNLTYRQTWKLTISGVTAGVLDNSTFDEDKLIWQTDPVTGLKVYATIVSWETNGVTGELEVTDAQGTISTSIEGVGGAFEYEDGFDSSLAGIVISAMEEPETVPGSGDVLYIQNIRPVTRSLEQGEEFRIQIGF